MIKPAPDAPTPPPLLIVLYDADCGFCRAMASWLRHRDRTGRLALSPLQDAAAPTGPWRAALACHDLRSTLHVVDLASGYVAEGGPAMLAVFRMLPRWGVAARLVGVRPLAPLVDLVYGLVAGHRDSLARFVGVGGPACQLPPTGPGSAP